MPLPTLKGTFEFSANNIAASNSMTTLASGSAAVAIGDLIYVVCSEQTSSSVTGITDSLGHTYTATQAAVTSGTVTGRSWYKVATAAGTLSSFTIASPGSTNNFAAVAGIFSGTVGAIDANPTALADNTSPFSALATGALAQIYELVISWNVSTGSAVFSATSPNLKAEEMASASVVSARLGYQTVNSTSTVTPAWTGTNPTNGIVGVTSFLIPIEDPPKGNRPSLAVHQNSLQQSWPVPTSSKQRLLPVAALLWVPPVDDPAVNDGVLRLVEIPPWHPPNRPMQIAAMLPPPEVLVVDDPPSEWVPRLVEVPGWHPPQMPWQVAAILAPEPVVAEPVFAPRRPPLAAAQTWHPPLLPAKQATVQPVDPPPLRARSVPFVEAKLWTPQRPGLLHPLLLGKDDPPLKVAPLARSEAKPWVPPAKQVQIAPLVPVVVAADQPPLLAAKRPQDPAVPWTPPQKQRQIAPLVEVVVAQSTLHHGTPKIVEISEPMPWQRRPQVAAILGVAAPEAPVDNPPLGWRHPRTYLHAARMEVIEWSAGDIAESVDRPPSGLDIPHIVEIPESVLQRPRRLVAAWAEEPPAAPVDNPPRLQRLRQFVPKDEWVPRIWTKVAAFTASVEVTVDQPPPQAGHPRIVEIADWVPQVRRQLAAVLAPAAVVDTVLRPPMQLPRFAAEAWVPRTRQLVAAILEPAVVADAPPFGALRPKAAQILPLWHPERRVAAVAAFTGRIDPPPPHGRWPFEEIWPKAAWHPAARRAGIAAAIFVPPVVDNPPRWRQPDMRTHFWPPDITLQRAQFALRPKPVPPPTEVPPQAGGDIHTTYFGTIRVGTLGVR